MRFYYAGFNTSTLFRKDDNTIISLDRFTEITFPDLSDFQIGWGYFLLRQNNKLYLMGKCVTLSEGQNLQLIQVPDQPSESYKNTAVGRNSILILLENNDIWEYKLYTNLWKKIPKFISNTDTTEIEYPVKVLQEGATVVLTNLGRVFNVPMLTDIPKRTKFIDVAGGFDHTILLAENGDIYSMGMGTRGQLGHTDLEDCDSPKLIEALAGIRVIQISAGGWHNAVITDQGDLYTWGWNTNGELGLITQDTKVVAVPTLADFKNENGEIIETFIKSVQCGNTFTICMTSDGTLWGCGSNKYGQLGQSKETLRETPTFVKLKIPDNINNIKSFKCREWGTVLLTD